MKRIMLYKILALCIVTSALFVFPSTVLADNYTYPITIVMSNVGYSTNTAHPALLNAVNASGISDHLFPYILATDIADDLGATLTYTSNYIAITISGQETDAYKNSTYFETINTYYNVYTTPTSTQNYQFFGYGYCYNSSAIQYNGDWYIQLNVLKSLGVLIYNMDSDTQYTVYDYRANYAWNMDNNQYVVGGPWLTSGYCRLLGSTTPGITSWASMSSHKLARNFAISELQDHSTYSENPNYYGQLKIAVQLLSAAQQVRYVDNGNSSMTLSCGFRSWYHNLTIVPSGAPQSFHTRGRALDATADALYYAVYNDFKGGHASPLYIQSEPSLGHYYRRQADVTWPIGDEIEPMPHNGSTWLHLQVDPSAQLGVASQYP